MVTCLQEVSHDQLVSLQSRLSDCSFFVNEVPRVASYKSSSPPVQLTDTREYQLIYVDRQRWPHAKALASGSFSSYKAAGYAAGKGFVVVQPDPEHPIAIASVHYDYDRRHLVQQIREVLNSVFDFVASGGTLLIAGDWNLSGGPAYKELTTAAREIYGQLSLAVWVLPGPDPAAQLFSRYTKTIDLIGCIAPPKRHSSHANVVPKPPEYGEQFLSDHLPVSGVISTF